MKLSTKNVSLNLLSGIVFSVFLLAGFYFGFDSRETLSDRNLVVGEPVVEGIVAVHDFAVPFSSRELDEMASLVEASVPVFLRSNTQTAQSSSEQIQDLIFIVTDNNELARYFAQRVSTLYTTGIIDIESLRMTYSGSRAITDNGLPENISELFTLSEARDGIRLDLERRGVLHEEIPVILELIIPDLEIDHGQREIAVQEGVENLSVIKKEFTGGEVILPPGGLFTEEISLYWDAMVLSPVGVNGIVGHKIAKTGIVTLLLLLGFLYVCREPSSFFFSTKDVLLLFTIWGLAMGLTILLFRSRIQELSIFSFTMLGASLTSVFFDSRLRKKTMKYSWFLAAIFSAVFALVSPHPMATFFLGFIPACIVSVAIRDLSDSGASLAVVLGMISFVAIYWLLTAAGSLGSMPMDSVRWITLLGLPLVIIGTVKVVSHPFELIFHVATARTYERLANDNHPLRELLRKEARGTYAHSVLVSDLASTAAEELGVDEKLAKLGGVFHDIGKLIKPEMFIENISNPDENNPHSLMLPEDSAKIIIGHVANGVELAEKHKLPSDICDIIEQHHGDTSARFFLEKARRELPPSGEFDQSIYHYNGPRPQSVEAALVMLADSVSSAVKGLGKTASTEKKIAIISRIIQEKTDEGQFDQCKLTGSMRTRVAHVFLEVLSQSDYERVPNYPYGNS